MNAMPFADQWITSGGKALGFHASTRIRLTLAGTLKDNTTKEIIGVKVKAKVIKNRLGPPHRIAQFNILFNRGIDDHASWYEVMKERKLVTGAAAHPVWTDPKTQEEIKFQKSTFVEKLLTDSKRRKVIYNQIADALIMTYEEADMDILEIAEAPENV